MGAISYLHGCRYNNCRFDQMNTDTKTATNKRVSNAHFIENEIIEFVPCCCVTGNEFICSAQPHDVNTPNDVLVRSHPDEGGIFPAPRYAPLFCTFDHDSVQHH